MTWTSKVRVINLLQLPPPHCFLPDQEWLDTVNTERRKEQIGFVAYGHFEIIMDRLEKEWFDLVSTPNIRGL